MAKTPDRTQKNPFSRKSRVIFTVVMILVSIFLIWPGYPVFSSATPFVFGFPLSFAWVIFCTVAGFIALLTLYFSDYKNGKAE